MTYLPVASGLRGRRLPPEPLAAAIRSWQTKRRLSMRQLSHLWVQRYGGHWSTPHRYLYRLYTGRVNYVTEDAADRWLTLLDSHVYLVYPESE